YRIELLVADIVELIRAFGKQRAVVVGHDWGAAVAWALARRHPECVAKLATLQVPLPEAWHTNNTLKQMLHSWYMLLFFQLPLLPEWWMRYNDFNNVARMYRRTSQRPEAFSDDDITVYKEALRQSGAVTAALNYYRANVLQSLFRRGRDRGERNAGIRVPTLFIYGERDVAVIPETVRDLGRFIEGPFREVRIPDSGHWVQNEAAA